MIGLTPAGRWEIDWKLPHLPLGDGRSTENCPISRWEMGDSDPYPPLPDWHEWHEWEFRDLVASTLDSMTSAPGSFSRFYTGTREFRPQVQKAVKIPEIMHPNIISII